VTFIWPQRVLSSSLKAEIRQLLYLALPVALVQVGLMAMGVVDTIMVGRVSANGLAAVALGNLYYFSVVVSGMGILMALDPVVAQAVGAGDNLGVARGLQRGLVIAAGLTVPLTLAMLPASSVLTALHQPAEVVPVAARYVWVCTPGVLPFLAFVVLRQSLQAMHRTAPIVVTILTANLANAGLNWVLIFGRLGFPPLGAVGAACATSISRWLMLGLLLLAGWKSLRPFIAPLRRDALAPRPLARMLRLGLPIGAQYELEVGAFAAIALLMGLLGTREIAGHQIAINLASLTFMVPLGVSSAAAVRVGHAVGRGDPRGARRSAAVALLAGSLFMSLTAALFLALPGPLARLYTGEAGVAAIAAALIPIAGVFQVFDGLQVVSIGALRGMGDTSAPMVVNILGFWLIGMPASIFLAFARRGGAAGLWWGMVLGLAAVAIFLLARVRGRLGREMSPLAMDEETAEVRMAGKA